MSQTAIHSLFWTPTTPATSRSCQKWERAKSTSRQLHKSRDILAQLTPGTCRLTSKLMLQLTSPLTMWVLMETQAKSLLSRTPTQAASRRAPLTSRTQRLPSTAPTMSRLTDIVRPTGLEIETIEDTTTATTFREAQTLEQAGSTSKMSQFTAATSSASQAYRQAASWLRANSTAITFTRTRLQLTKTLIPITWTQETWSRWSALTSAQLGTTQHDSPFTFLNIITSYYINKH